MKALRDVKRAYASPLRAGQAAGTRATILEAAARLFIANGYASTSVEDIARAAGVSRATVFSAVGGKPVLLKTAYDVALVGDDEPVAFGDRPTSLRVKANPDQRATLAGYAELLTEMGGRLAGIREAVRGAAGADLDARSLWEATERERFMGARNVVTNLSSKGPLRGGLDRESAADLVWVYNDIGLYDRLVLQRGWAPDRFRDWLTATLAAQLLPPRRR